MTEEVEEQVQEQVPAEETLADKLRGFLLKFEEAPGDEEINSWKADFTDVYAAGFSEDELFIFRSVNRQEYRELQAAAQEQQDPTFFEKALVDTCLLWASVLDLDSKAGNYPTLLEMVMQNSNFVTPQLASQLVAKL